MTKFLKFFISSDKTIYVNRNYITDFNYDQKANRTVISLPGTGNFFEILDDQTKKILEGDDYEA